MTESERKEYAESVYNGTKMLRDALPTVEQAAKAFYEAEKKLREFEKKVKQNDAN